MEQPHQLQNVQNDQEGVGGCNGSGKSSNYLCRQSSTRWTPTTDQIRILKELYYNNGVRSPNAEQIQRISARLRQYGKIEGKNVFYWFQNHKARERQKKRFTTPTTTNTDHHLQLHRGGNNCATAIGNGFWKADDSSNFQTKYPNANPGFCASSSSSPAGVVPLGQMVGSFGYGPMMTMENNFRDCSISAGGANACNGVSFNNNFQGCGGANTYHQCYTFLDDKISSEVLQEGGEGDGPELETLPLFPMHGEDNNPLNFSFMKSDVDNYYGGCYNGGSRACLELSLNSYGGNGQIFN